MRRDEEQRIAVMFVDHAGLPRAYAVGPERVQDEVIERARGHLQRWCQRMGREPGDYRMVIEPFEPLPPSPSGG